MYLECWPTPLFEPTTHGPSFARLRCIAELKLLRVNTKMHFVKLSKVVPSTCLYPFVQHPLKFLWISTNKIHPSKLSEYAMYVIIRYKYNLVTYMYIYTSRLTVHVYSTPIQ